jgi:hypothetical protein
MNVPSFILRSQFYPPPRDVHRRTGLRNAFIRFHPSHEVSKQTVNITLQSIYICHVEEICLWGQWPLSGFWREHFMNENRRWPRTVFLNEVSVSISLSLSLSLSRLVKRREGTTSARYAALCEWIGGGVRGERGAGRTRAPVLAPAPPLCYVHHNT